MSGNPAGANDTYLRRLEDELRNKDMAGKAIIERANVGNRDLTEEEQEFIGETRSRMEQIKSQMEQVQDFEKVGYEARNNAKIVERAVAQYRSKPDAGEVEYRSAGEYVVDSYKSHLGDRDATERLEIFYRAAAHSKTSDNLGIVPDPIVGNVVNFIDASRPIVSALGARPLPSATWHRPVVTQHTTVDKQGSAGAPADEKSELVSQKMTITRLNASAVTYGGYVNVSRQNIDFTTPSVMDIIVQDLASQYAIDTEAVTAAAITATPTTAIGYGASPTQVTIAGALWKAVAQVYTAVKGQGQLLLVVAPDVLGTFGPLFQPVNPQNSQSPGLSAGMFGQGTMGSISGVPVVMSAGLATGKAFLLSTAAMEVYEQRVGTLQVTEPSVLGVQVAYAGYFTPLAIANAAIVPLTAT